MEPQVIDPVLGSGAFLYYTPRWIVDLMDRDLDCKIAERVMAKPWRKPTHGTCCTCQACGHDRDNCACGWSTDVEKTHAVIERMAELGFDFRAQRFCSTGETHATFGKWPAEMSYTAHGQCFARAVCRAALAALAAGEGRDGN